MGIKQSNFTGGYGRQNMSAPKFTNTETVDIIEHVFNDALASTDILELFPLPNNCRITALTVLAVGTAAATVNMGFMSGDVGSVDPARTLGTELIAAGTPTTAITLTPAQILALGKTQHARSIGVQFSANVAASGTTKLTVLIRYAEV